ncbi:MAG: hypothetical protein H0W96_06875 [Solirubrobacterales bacterium]|nr:hypothetical protein [Solirubrobacterales bacterium]
MDGHELIRLSTAVDSRFSDVRLPKPPNRSVSAQFVKLNVQVVEYFFYTLDDKNDAFTR